MFESPQAKRIRRSKVFDSGSSSSSDEEVTETTTIKEIQDSIGLSYHFDYDIIENGAGKVTKFAHLQVDEPENVPIQEKTPPDDNESFEFRLFATPKPPNAKAPDIGSKTNETSTTKNQKSSNKITIRSPTPDVPSSGSFINPNRPQTYYFTTTPPPRSITLSAISGPTILSSSHEPWPGTFLPWRVIHLPSSAKLPPPNPLYDGSKAQATQKPRKPSKKRRIQFRTRMKLMDAKAKEKEQHLRQKKTRLNRERKVKRREKEKAEKEKMEKEKMEKEKMEKEKMEEAEKEKERERVMVMVGKGVEGGGAE